MHTNFILFTIWIMMSLVRHNYSTESKTLYFTLVLFSVPDVELIWQQCHHHLTQLHQFLSINNFDLSENKVIFIYIHFFSPMTYCALGYQPSSKTPPHLLSTPLLKLSKLLSFRQFHTIFLFFLTSPLKIRYFSEPP